MELSEALFERGVVDCWRVFEEDVRRKNSADAELVVARAGDAQGQVRRIEESIRDVGVPLWQRISELSTPEAERSMRPMVRRDRIRKLLRAVDRILRAELKTPVVPETASAGERLSLEATKAERTIFWDPLPEVCFYLQIGQSRLAQYSRQLTGLGARDLVDRIRVENLRALLRERLRKAAVNAQKFCETDVRQLGARDGAGVVMKAWRADAEGFVNRQELALSVGIASRQRLYRAVLACEGITLEELERQEAEKVFTELRGAPVVSVEAKEKVMDGVESSEVKGGEVMRT